MYVLDEKEEIAPSLVEDDDGEGARLLEAALRELFGDSKAYHLAGTENDHDQSTHGNRDDSLKAPVGVKDKSRDDWKSTWYSFPAGGDWTATRIKSVKLSDLPKYRDENGVESDFTDGGWTWMSEQLEKIFDATIPEGHKLVVRLGSGKNSLDNRNAADINGLVEFLGDINDIEKPGNMYGVGDTITAYAVKIGKTGDYQTLRGAGRSKKFHGDGSHDDKDHGNWADDDRAERAKVSYVRMDADKLRKALDQESKIAEWIGGKDLGDNEPFDVLVGRDHALEVKTIIEGKNPKITVHPPSLKRKRAFLNRSKRTGHTVVIDIRGARPQYYYRQGIGSFRLANMEPTSPDQLKRMFQ